MNEPKIKLNLGSSKEEKVTPNFTHEALGIFKNEKTGAWCVAVIKYDPVTKVAGAIEEVEAGESRDFGIEKFKILASEKDLVG